MNQDEPKKTGPYHHGNLREALIVSAVNLLESEGEAALTLRRIAQKTGVSQAAPYSHFRSKNDLLTAVCVAGTQWFSASMRQAAAGREGTDYLAGLASGYIRFAREHPALFQLMNKRDVFDAVDEKGKAILLEGIDLLSRGLAAAPLAHFGTRDNQLDLPLAWGQVYGLTNLVLEGRIQPQDYGFQDLEAFIQAMVNRFLQHVPQEQDSLGS